MAYGYSLIEISSESMQSAGFNKNDKAFIKRKPAQEYVCGDYIAFFDC